MEELPENNTDNHEWKDKAVKVLGDLAHSLRNPFSTLQSYINILEMEDYSTDPEELKMLTKSLQETVDKSIKLIDEKILALKDSLTKH